MYFQSAAGVVCLEVNWPSIAAPENHLQVSKREIRPVDSRPQLWERSLKMCAEVCDMLSSCTFWCWRERYSVGLHGGTLDFEEVEGILGWHITDESIIL
jgi:hypothetical protein